MTRVSVITPSYNQAQYLEETIQSVLRQDYPQVEYILVDGGSDDGSLEIIHRYAPQLAWWVSEPDRGQAEAINKGLSRASGEIVAWLNSDDVYLPGAIREAVDILEENPEIGMVFGDAISIDSQGNPLNELKFGDWGLDELMGFRMICQPAVFMRREAQRQAGPLDSSYHYLLDHHLWIRLALQAPLRHAARKWACARQHPGAKNVAQAAGFGLEAYRIQTWMGTHPELKERAAANRKRIAAGAHRLNARYLLDGGKAGPALKSYWRALLADPGFALQHWHRMLYAVACLIGLDGLAGWYYRLRPQRPIRLEDDFSSRDAQESAGSPHRPPGASA
jgi:glycosyltransferase involved in cell wall biosynthesis